MRCIFCKEDSSDSKSIEHIIPESLGNKSHKLPVGVVCDKCNNYFAHKIEKKVLELSYFKALRSRNIIENKKGRIPGIPGFIKDYAKDELEIYFTNGSEIEVIVPDKKLYSDIEHGAYKEFYIPITVSPPFDNIYISKLLGKIALEASAQRLMVVEDWQNEFINNDGLDQLRNYVRFGNGYKFWPYHQRKIYEEGIIFTETVGNSNTSYEILHEYDFLFPNKPTTIGEIHSIDNLYFVCAIMGMEYVINLTNKGLDVYVEWLKKNENKSILMMDKNDFNNFYI